MKSPRAWLLAPLPALPNREAMMITDSNRCPPAPSTLSSSSFFPLAEQNPSLLFLPPFRNHPGTYRMKAGNGRGEGILLEGMSLTLELRD